MIKEESNEDVVIKHLNMSEMKMLMGAGIYTVKKVNDFPVSRRDVTNQTLSGPAEEFD
jgi:hypothetical protein